MHAKDISKKLRDYYQVYIPDESIVLFNRYLSRLPDGSQALEVGTGWGKSAAAMALCHKGIMVDTLDSGEFQIACGWAKSRRDYMKKVLAEWRKVRVKNVNLHVQDWFTYKSARPYDALHLDAPASLDAKALRHFLPFVKDGGIIFVRNYFRFKKEADKILKNCTYLANAGMVQVVRK